MATRPRIVKKVHDLDVIKMPVRCKHCGNRTSIISGAYDSLETKYTHYCGHCGSFFNASE